MSRVLRWTAVVLGVGLVCGACGTAPELEPDRAVSLQESVLAVTQAASESRWVDAQALLVQTRVTLDDGVDEGEVSTARYREIDAALDQVAAELAAAQAVVEQAAAAQAAAEQAAAQAAADQAAAEQAAAQQAAAEKAAEPPGHEKPAPAPKDKGKGGP